MSDRQYVRANAFKVLHHVCIADPNGRQALAPHPIIARRIVRWVMRVAVDFNDQPDRWTEEVWPDAFDPMLLPKLQTTVPTRA